MNPTICRARGGDREAQGRGWHAGCNEGLVQVAQVHATKEALMKVKTGIRAGSHGIEGVRSHPRPVGKGA